MRATRESGTLNGPKARMLHAVGRHLWGGSCAHTVIIQEHLPHDEQGWVPVIRPDMPHLVIRVPRSSFELLDS